MIEPILVLRDIIKTEMNLQDDRILLYNQKWTLPNSFDIFVSLMLGTYLVYANRINYEDRQDGFYEAQNLNVRENIIIDIFSYDNTARTRKEEVVLALRSTYSQQKQEENSIKIAKIPPSFLDVSVVESSVRLNRYNITVPVLCWRTKEKQIEYFDTYSYEVKTNK